MAEKAIFRCLRCGHEYEDNFTRGVPQELTCPKCGSNSVRRLEKKRGVKK